MSDRKECYDASSELGRARARKLEKFNRELTEHVNRILETEDTIDWTDDSGDQWVETKTPEKPTTAIILKYDATKKPTQSFDPEDSLENRIKVLLHNTRWFLALEQKNGNGIDASQAILIKRIGELEEALKKDLDARSHPTL